MPDPESRLRLQEREYEIPYHWKETVSAHPPDRLIRDFVVPPESVAGKTLLDAGCGDGLLSFRLQRLGAEVYGVDISGRALRWARLFVPEAKFVLADLTEPLPFGRIFDLVFLREVLEHIPPARVPACLKSIRDSLKDDGVLLLSVPANRPHTPKHYQHFDGASLTAALSPHFVCELFGYDGPQRKWRKLVSRACNNRYYEIKPVMTCLRRRYPHVPLKTARTIVAKCTKRP